VDATYRSELRETNELNFTRFMSSVDQRFAEQDANLEKRFGHIDARFADLRADLLKWMFIYWTGTMLALPDLFLACASAT
jgi:hypothetical protein